MSSKSRIIFRIQHHMHQDGFYAIIDVGTKIYKGTEAEMAKCCYQTRTHRSLRQLALEVRAFKALVLSGFRIIKLKKVVKKNAQKALAA